MRRPDNFSQWEANERRLERELARRPVCAECGEHIQDETAFFINGELICENCVEIYRVEVSEFNEASW